MNSYKTIKEKAAEWNTSLRHLQYLCKNGGIEGAVKRAGVWFIPDNVPMPKQYTKAKNGSFNFVGTKKKIFNCATELFQLKGFEAVSIKDIADAVGITQSSVYNHFKSKQKILDTIYDYYSYYFLKDRPTMEDIELILRGGSLTEILMGVRYEFSETHRKQMGDITAILIHRCAIDKRAMSITRTLMFGEGIRYVQEVLDRAIEIGRIEPIDTHALSMLINSIRLFSLHSWLVSFDNEDIVKLINAEFKLYDMVATLLTDKKVPEGEITAHE